MTSIPESCLPRYPCKDCTERTIACHDRCERYQQVKAEREQLKKQWGIDHGIEGYQSNNILKRMDLRAKHKRYRSQSRCYGYKTK